MTRSKKLRVLHEIYASIPSAGCKGLCADECTTIPVFPFELEQLEAAAGRKLPTMDAGDDLGGQLLGSKLGDPCPLLVLGRCSAYDQRPLICRAFGSVEGLRCSHGCRPAELVSTATQYRHFERVAAL
jgi:uncharacterized protein